MVADDNRLHLFYRGVQQIAVQGLGRSAASTGHCRAQRSRDEYLADGPGGDEPGGAADQSRLALAGGFLGGMAALAFLWRLEVVEVRVSPSLIGGGMVILLLSAMAPKYNAEKLLNHVAVAVSGADEAHQEPSWRAAPTLLNAE